MNPKVNRPMFITKRDYNDLNLLRFSIDLERQNLPEKIGPELEKDPNASYNIFYARL